jgi:fatty-acyl-CoA synthase
VSDPLSTAAPDAPVLELGTRVWTRAGFEAEVLAAQERLRGEGVQRGAIVAWLGVNSVEMLATFAACAPLGAVFLPLNWRLAAPELARIVEHAGAGHLLGTAEVAPLAAAVRGAARLRPGPVAGVENGDRLLVYTSGSTGEPKGALHTAAGIAANIRAAIDAQGFDAATRVLTVLPMFHVGGLCIQTLPALAAGGRVRLHARFDPGAWLRDVAAWRPTTSLLVPAVMKALIEHPDWSAADLSSLSFVNSGSQVVPVSLIDAFHARGVPVCQVYGATETGPVSIVLRRDEAMANAGRAGRAALDVQVRLAADGELRLKAPNLMRGYHRSTAPAFDAEGWFHTGDLARLHADGLYEVVGRSKDLIISGGENIHPAEIENLLAQHPDVAECCVVGVPDPRWGEVPVLVVVARLGRSVDEAALQALFAERLAGFKRPRRIVLAVGLPRTALGKVQRARLAAQLAAPR